MAEEGGGGGEGLLSELVAILHFKVEKEDFERANELIESVHHALEAFAVFEGVEWLKELFKGAEEGAVAVKHLSDRLGMTTDDVQRLGYAADVSGASSQVMATGLQRMAMGLEQARTKGTGPFVRGIRDLGLSMSDPILKSGTLMQVTNRVADGFKNAGPKANVAGAQLALLGRRGSELAPVFKLGADGIKKLGDEFAEIGGVATPEAIEAFEDLEHAQKKLHATWKAITETAVSALVPAVKEIVDGIQKWVTENRKLIALRLEELFDALVFVLRQVIWVGGMVFDIFGWLAEHATLVKVAILSLIVAYALLNRAAIYSAIKVAAAWVAAFLPLIVAAALVAVIILVIQDLVRFLEGKRSVIGDFFNALGPDAGAKIYTFITQYLGVAWDWVKDKAAKTWDAIGDYVESIDWGSILDSIWVGFKHVLGMVRDGWVLIFENAWDAVKDPITALVGEIGKIFSTLGSVLYSVLTAPFWPFKKAIELLIAHAREVWDFFTTSTSDLNKKNLAGAVDLTAANPLATRHSAAVAAMLPGPLAGPTKTSGGSADSGAGAAPQVQQNITVHVPTGADAKAVGDAVVDAGKRLFDELWNEKLRTAFGGSGGKATP